MRRGRDVYVLLIWRQATHHVIYLAEVPPPRSLLATIIVQFSCAEREIGTSRPNDGRCSRLMNSGSEVAHFIIRIQRLGFQVGHS